MLEVFSVFLGKKYGFKKIVVPVRVVATTQTKGILLINCKEIIIETLWVEFTE